MTRLLLAAFLLLPAVLMAQDTTTCSQLAIDLDGDLQLGAGDILMLLGGYGTDLDVDGDMIPDCQDDCVGAYDTCGVCNGPGPEVLAIDTIIITYDSVYVDAIDDWLVYELESDTLFSLVCEESNVFSSCGDDVEMDGYYYSTVLIGNQCWFAENLRTTVYANGDAIPAGFTDYEWTWTTSGATAVYGEDDECYSWSPDIFACDETQSLAEYGRLYNWYSVDDARGLCPSGWHVPTDGEWTDLEDYITEQGLIGTEGTTLKSTYGWFNGGNGTDNFGFSALPGGYRGPYDGFFGSAGDSGYWWSSSLGPTGPWARDLDSGYPDIDRAGGSLRGGYSVRCLRDAD